MFSSRNLRALSAFTLLCLPLVVCEKDKEKDDAQQDDDDDDSSATGSTSTGDDDDENNECIPGADQCPAGQKCQPYVKEDGGCCVDAARCVPLIGDKKQGESCTRSRYEDDCGRDVFCMGPTSGDEGTGSEFQCYALCDQTERDTSCADLGIANAVCNPYNNGVLPWCDIPCNPLRPTSCAEGDGCYPFLDGHWCFPPDVPEGGGNQSDPCVVDAEHSCFPGLYCNYKTPDLIPNCESAACCTRYCDLEGDGNECETPATCEPFWAEDSLPWDPAFKTEVGHCILGSE